MDHEGRDYDEVLAAAQAAGYAESDPTGDVEGHDAANKLVILARLAFGCWLAPAAIALADPDGPGHGRPGITGVTSDDIAAAIDAGEVVKLIASATAGSAGAPPVASVLATRLAGGQPAGPDRRRPEPDRDRRRAGRDGRLQRTGRRRGGDLERGPRRPDRTSPAAWAARRGRACAPAAASVSAARRGAARLAPSLVERYRAFLPVSDATPVVSLGEGLTPLVHLRRLGARLGLANLYAKIEGQNPTGSFKDRGMVLAVAKAVEDGARAIICASTGNTSASAAAYGAAHGLEVVVVLPAGKIAMGKLLQASWPVPGSWPSRATSTRRSGSSGRSPSRTTTRSRW